MSTTPLQTVGTIYAAFGRGDVPAILATLSPEVAWESWLANEAQSAGVPWLAGGSGPDAVATFFGVVSRNLVVRDFQVLDMFGSGRQVAVEVRLVAEVVASGRQLSDEELHLWTFDDAGKVIRMRHYVDTLKHARAAGLIAP